MRCLCLALLYPLSNPRAQSIHTGSRLLLGCVLSWCPDAVRVRTRYRKVLDAFVVKDRDSGESRGFGFVNFETERAMNDAIDAMDGQDLGGRTIRVNPAGETSASAPRTAGGEARARAGPGPGGVGGNAFRCYVGGLNFSTREGALRRAFGEFGELLECTVVMERDDPERSRGFGFVACTFLGLQLNSHAESTFHRIAYALGRAIMPQYAAGWQISKATTATYLTAGFASHCVTNPQTAAEKRWKKL